mmetsp:Transcript_36180/g.65646  ORF Transcript_36180/g.65646 Transcript_36180/m.65646 type:complete len:215 (-) Transcript_36180:439-1083(-)
MLSMTRSASSDLNSCCCEMTYWTDSFCKRRSMRSRKSSSCSSNSREVRLYTAASVWRTNMDRRNELLVVVFQLMSTLSMYAQSDRMMLLRAAQLSRSFNSFRAFFDVYAMSAMGLNSITTISRCIIISFSCVSLAKRSSDQRTKLFKRFFSISDLLMFMVVFLLSTQIPTTPPTNAPALNPEAIPMGPKGMDRIPKSVPPNSNPWFRAFWKDLS